MQILSIKIDVCEGVFVRESESQRVKESEREGQG